VPRDGLCTFRERHSEFAYPHVTVTQVDTGICTSNHKNCITRQAQAQIVGTEGVSNPRRKIRSASEAGRGTRPTAAEVSPFNFAKDSTSQANELTHCWWREAKVDMSLIDSAHVRLERSNMDLVLLLQPTKVEKHGGGGRRRKGQGRKSLARLHVGTKPKEAIKLALRRVQSTGKTSMRK
jgi:hypothetical protein